MLVLQNFKMQLTQFMQYMNDHFGSKSDIWQSLLCPITADHSGAFLGIFQRNWSSHFFGFLLSGR